MDISRRLQTRGRVKLINEPIEMKTEGRRPRLFRWRGRLYDVRALLDYWVLQSKWWTGREERRVYMKVYTNRGTVEIYRSGEKWVLAKVYD